MADDADRTRRRFLTVISSASVGAAALAAARLAVAPAQVAGGGAPWAVVAKLAELREGVPTRVVVVADQKDGFTTAKNQMLGAVWLVKKGTNVLALSAVCPHSGCTVDISSNSKEFFCPCHSSYFQFDGERSPGKPNKALRGMDPVPVKVDGGDVAVQLVRFKLGTASREAIG